MNDPEIRALLAPHLTHYQAVVGELVIVGGATRADLACLTDDCIHGIEIKGDGDTLKRIPAQLEGYAKVFSRVTFCVTEKHVPKLIAMLPDWAGIWVVMEGKGQYEGYHIYELRAPEPNPNQSKYWLSGLLWGEELRALCKRHGLPARAKWRVWESQDALEASELVTMRVLETFVTSCLLARMAGKLKRRTVSKLIRSR